MRLVSWNIQGGKDLAGVTEMLDSLDPDVVALQEVKQNEQGNSAHMLAAKLGYAAAYGGAFITERHAPSYELGNAVLSKGKITRFETVVLSSLAEYEGSSTTEPRNAIIAEVATPAGPLHVVSSHAGYSKGLERTDIRDRQVGKLLHAMAGLSPAVLGIDLNSEPGSYALATVSASLVNTDTENTAVTWVDTKVDPATEHRIDYILRTSDVGQTGFQVIPTTASDHNLLVMDFELPNQYV